LFLLSFKELFADFLCCLSSEEVRIIGTKILLSTKLLHFVFYYLFLACGNRENATRLMIVKLIWHASFASFQPRRSEEVRIIGIQKVASTHL
jgi:hypothetical protein